METNENLRDIFSILHDGTIIAWVGDRNLLTLIVDCEYLAELIDPSFGKFYIELSNIDKIELDPWTLPIEAPTVIKTELADIFKAELEILNADIKGEAVDIICNQHDKYVDYSGGKLTVSCKQVEIFDQNKTRLTIDQLDEICNRYWNK